MLDATTLWGSPNKIVSRIDEIRRLGVDEVVLRFPEGIGPDAMLKQLAALAPTSR